MLKSWALLNFLNYVYVSNNEIVFDILLDNYLLIMYSYDCIHITYEI